MNKLQTDKRAQILTCLCEGNSLRSTFRLTGTSINTIVKLLIDAGNACTRHQDEVFRNLSCKRIQCDEIWAFSYAKNKNCTEEMKHKGAGSVWTWAAIDADTKLIPCWYVGNRDAVAAYHFMHDLAGRLAHRVQLTTDAHRPYLVAVEDAFGGDIDFAQLIEIYGKPFNEGPEARYSPAQCMGARKAVISGKPSFAQVSTSLVERQNLTMRMGMRRFTRLTNAFSKKVETHGHAVALHFMHYNFCRIHKSLHVTPAMEAGITDHVWSLEELADMISEKSN
jgi:IS1 family transposase